MVGFCARAISHFGNKKSSCCPTSGAPLHFRNCFYANAGESTPTPRPQGGSSEGRQRLLLGAPEPQGQLPAALRSWAVATGGMMRYSQNTSPGSLLCLPCLELKAGDPGAPHASPTSPDADPAEGPGRLPRPWASLEDGWHQGLTCNPPPPSSASGLLACCHGNGLKIKWAPKAQHGAQESKQTN